MSYPSNTPSGNNYFSDRSQPQQSNKQLLLKDLKNLGNGIAILSRDTYNVIKSNPTVQRSVNDVKSSLHTLWDTSTPQNQVSQSAQIQQQPQSESIKNKFLGVVANVCTSAKNTKIQFQEKLIESQYRNDRRESPPSYYSTNAK